MYFLLPAHLHSLFHTEYIFHHRSYWHKAKKFNNKLQHFCLNVATLHKIIYARSVVKKVPMLNYVMLNGVLSNLASRVIVHNLNYTVIGGYINY